MPGSVCAKRPSRVSSAISESTRRTDSIIVFVRRSLLLLRSAEEELPRSLPRLPQPRTVKSPQVRRVDRASESRSSCASLRIAHRDEVESPDHRWLKRTAIDCRTRPGAERQARQTIAGSRRARARKTGRARMLRYAEVTGREARPPMAPGTRSAADPGWDLLLLPEAPRLDRRRWPPAPGKSERETRTTINITDGDHTEDDADRMG